MAGFWASWPAAAQIVFLLATCFVTISMAALLKVVYSRWIHRRHHTCSALDAPTAYKPMDEMPQSHDLEANALPLPQVKSRYEVKTLQHLNDDGVTGRKAAALSPSSDSHDSLHTLGRPLARSSTGSEYKIAYIIGKEEALATSPSRTRYNSVNPVDATKEPAPKDPPCQPAPGLGQHRSSTPQGAGKQAGQSRSGKDPHRDHGHSKDPWSPERLLSFERLTPPEEIKEERPKKKKLWKRPKVQFRHNSDAKPPSVESEKDCVWFADDAFWKPGRLRQRVSPAYVLTDKASFNTVDLGMPEALTSMYPRRDNRSSSDNTVKTHEVLRRNQQSDDPHQWVAPAPWQVYQGLPPTLPRLPSDHTPRKPAAGSSRTKNTLQKPKISDATGKQPVFSPRTASLPSQPRFYATSPTTPSPGPVPDLELDSLPRHESNLHEHEQDLGLAPLPLANHDCVFLEDDSQKLLTETFAKAEDAPNKNGKTPATGPTKEARSGPSRWLGLGPRTLRKVKRDEALRKSFGSAGSGSSRRDID